MPTEPPGARLQSARIYLEQRGERKHPVYGFLLRYARQLHNAARANDAKRLDELTIHGPTPPESGGDDE